MLEDLKLGPRYDGFIYLAESARHLPTIRSHHHEELELNLVVRGAVSYVVNGRRFTFERRALLWLFPAQEHQLVDRSCDAEFFVVAFKRRLIKRACRSAAYRGLKRRGTAEGVLHTVLEPESFDLMQKMMRALLEGAPDADVLNREAGFGARSDFRFEHGDPDGLNAGLQHLLLLGWRCQRTGRAFGGAVALHPAVTAALKLVSESEGECYPLSRLAQRCGASAEHLSRMFARQVGVPLSRYRGAVRLRRFFERYRGEFGRSISEAAYEAGFGSYAQFYRVFSRAYGKGPRACLADHRSGFRPTVEPRDKKR